MCIFCAAIPLSATLGAAAAGKQHQAHAQAQVPDASADLAPRPLPTLKLTAAVTGGLIVCSAVYHLVIYPHTGIVL